MDVVQILGKLVLIVFLVALNGFFVAAEFSIVKMRSSRLDTLIAEGVSGARYAKYLVDHVDISLSVTQLGITIVSLVIGWLGEPTISQLMEPIFVLTGIAGTTLAHTISFVVSFAVVTAMHIIIGELIPKNIAIQYVEKVMLTVAFPLTFFHKIMYPSVWALNKIAFSAAKLCGVEISGKNGDAAHTEDEIRVLMEESHKQGYIDKTELEYVDNVFDFADRNVREIMIPRTDMICLYLEDPLDENIQIVLSEGMTRYPVCKDDKDNVIGFLHIKDLMTPLSRHRRPRIRRLIRKCLVVPETMKIAMLLKMMQKERSQLAIVVDEYGGTAGMVTIEDIIEEIVGEIQDEFDQERPTVEKRGDKLFSVDAKLLLEDLNDILEVNVEMDNVDTIGGWLYANIQSPPQVGMKAIADNTEFFVEEVDNLRIIRVLVKMDKELTEEHEEIKDRTSNTEQENKVK